MITMSLLSVPFAFALGDWWVETLAVLAAPLAQRGGGDGIGPIIGILFWVGVIVGVIVYMRNQRVPFQGEIPTTLAPGDAIRMTVQTYTMDGWQVTSQTGDNATFVKSVKGSCLIAAILLLIGFIPGILYLAFSGRSISTNVYARATGSSGTMVQISSTASGWGGREIAERVLKALPTSSGPIPQPA